MYLDFGALGTKVVRGTTDPTALPLTAEQQEAVGAFVGGDGMPFCTGTLVAQHIVLTAQHCGIQPGDRFVIGRDATSPDDWAYVAAVLEHPAWSGWKHDHALVLLDRKLAAVPLPLAAQSPAIGSTVQGVGYGLTAAGSFGQPIRWWVAEPVASVGDGMFVVEGMGTHGLCNGDSGGPALVAGPSGPAVAGTVSQGETSCVGEDIYSIPDDAWAAAGIAKWPAPGSAPLGARLASLAVPIGIGGLLLAVGVLIVSRRRRGGKR
jgi:hypothetical protein